MTLGRALADHDLRENPATAPPYPPSETFASLIWHRVEFRERQGCAMACAINPDDATLQQNLPAIDGPAYALVVAADGSIFVAGSNGQSHRVVVSGERN